MDEERGAYPLVALTGGRPLPREERALARVQARAALDPAVALEPPPAAYAANLGRKIVEATREGVSLLRIASRFHVSRSQILKWEREYSEFAQAMEEARKDAATLMIDDTMEIADAATPEDLQVAKTQIENRRWIAARRVPEKYGDKIEINDNSTIGSFVALSKKYRQAVEDGEIVE